MVNRKCWLILAAVLAGYAASYSKAVGQEVCERPPPVIELGGVQWYADKAGSVVDKEKRRLHELAMKPLYDLLRVVAKAADQSFETKAATPALECALSNLQIWATNGALLTRPKWGFSLAEQTIAVLGLNIAALKLKSVNVDLPSDLNEWLRKVTDTLIATFENSKQKSNIYVWAGAAAASNDLLSGGTRLRGFHDRVWAESIAKIRPDGYVDDELARGARAHIYHNYLRSASVFLQRIREKMGIVARPEDAAALARLETVVNAATCDSGAIIKLVGVKQTPFTHWDTSIGTHLALADKDEAWRRCTKTPAAFAGPTYGGRFDYTSRAIDQVSGK